MTRARLRASWLAALAAAGAVLASSTPPLRAQTPPPKSGAPEEGKTAAEIADSLFLAGDMEASYAVLTARLGLDPDDFEARWRATRVALGFGIVGATHGERQTWLREADAHGRELLRARPDDPEALAWAAAARGRRALGEDDPRTVVNLAQETWDLTGTLLAAHPDHPLGNHVRGKLHQEVARLPAVKRLLARVFLGGKLLSEAKWELAEEHLLRAITGDPGMVLFYLDLGETYRFQGKNTAALAVYRRGLAVPNRLPIDPRFKATMERRIATLEGAGKGP